MAPPSERILVTGASGFTGRHLCDRLRASGHRVFGLTQEPASGPDQWQAELSDGAALAAIVREAVPTAVVHLAAISHPRHADTAEIYRTNLGGTLTLLEALAQAARKPERVLLASTATVYADPGPEAITESSAIAPTTHYAVSKLAMEQMAKLFAAQLPLVVVRPFNYTGPGQREPFVVPKIVRHFAERAAVIELGNVDVVRDFQDVRTVADTYARLLAAPGAAGRTFNICSGRGVFGARDRRHADRADRAPDRGAHQSGSSCAHPIRRASSARPRRWPLPSGRWRPSPSQRRWPTCSPSTRGRPAARP